MNNSLALLANEPPPRLVGSRYSRLIRCYSFQEILFEYCICFLLLVSVALVIFVVGFLRSEIRGGICSGDCTDGSLVSLQVLWLFTVKIYSCRAINRSHEWRWSSSAIIWLCWERKSRKSFTFNIFKEMEQQSTIDLYLGKANKTAPNNTSGIFLLKL